MAADSSTSAESVTTESDQGVLLNYIEKVDRAWTVTASAASRLLVTEVVLSAFLAVFSLGIVSANNEISISGIKFSAPLWSLLVGGAIVTVGVNASRWGAVYRAIQLQLEITELYKRAGFDVPVGFRSLRNPWILPGSLENAEGPGWDDQRHRGLGDFVVAFPLFLGVTFLPFAAIAAASVACVRSFGGGVAWLLMALPACAAANAVGWFSRVFYAYSSSST